MCRAVDGGTPKSELFILQPSLVLIVLCDRDKWGMGNVLDAVLVGNHTSKPFVPAAPFVLDFSCAQSEFIMSMLVRNA